MKVTAAKIPGLLIIEPTVYADTRGFFMETYSQDRYAKAKLPTRFVQDNLSLSMQGTLRGLHLQHPHGQGKLCTVFEGEVFDVAVDVRTGSPSFGQWEGIRLSSESMRQLYIPPGFAHGFCVLSDRALFSYKCTEIYTSENEIGVAWNDEDIGIEWPIDDPCLSHKDSRNPRLRDLPPDRLPRYH